MSRVGGWKKGETPSRDSHDLATRERARPGEIWHGIGEGNGKPPSRDSHDMATRKKGEALRMVIWALRQAIHIVTL